MIWERLTQLSWTSNTTLIHFNVKFLTSDNWLMRRFIDINCRWSAKEFKTFLRLHIAPTLTHNVYISNIDDCDQMKVIHVVIESSNSRVSIFIYIVIVRYWMSRISHSWSLKTEDWLIEIYCTTLIWHTSEEIWKHRNFSFPSLTLIKCF